MRRSRPQGGARRGASCDSQHGVARNGALAPTPARLAWSDTLALGSQGLTTRKARTVLSALGIAIGIAALVAVMGLAASSKADLMAQLDSLGTNLLRVAAGQSMTGKEAVLPEQAPGMVDRIPTVEESATTYATGQKVYRNHAIPEGQSSGLTVLGADQSLLGALRAELAEGRWLDAATSRYPAVVLGAKAAERLGLQDLSRPPTVMIGGRPFAVIGILKPVALAPELDSSVLMGEPIARALYGTKSTPAAASDAGTPGTESPDTAPPNAATSANAAASPNAATSANAATSTNTAASPNAATSANAAMPTPNAARSTNTAASSNVAASTPNTTAASPNAATSINAAFTRTAPGATVTNAALGAGSFGTRSPGSTSPGAAVSNARLSANAASASESSIATPDGEPSSSPSSTATPDAEPSSSPSSTATPEPEPSSSPTPDAEPTETPTPDAEPTDNAEPSSEPTTPAPDTEPSDTLAPDMELPDTGSLDMDAAGAGSLGTGTSGSGPSAPTASGSGLPANAGPRTSSPHSDSSGSGSSDSAASPPEEPDSSVFAPATIYTRVQRDAIDATRAILPRTANPAAPSEVAVSRPSEALTAQAAADQSLTTLSLGLGAIGLLVGGVGIANVMVIAVLERRREIGVRRALGATRGAIRTQFIIESMALALLGGACGAVLGQGAAAGFAIAQGWAAVIAWPAIATGLVGSLLIGALAGSFPAMRAAKVSPTEALRAV